MIKIRQKQENIVILFLLKSQATFNKRFIFHIINISEMKKASPYAFLQKRKQKMQSEPMQNFGQKKEEPIDLNVFVVTFDGMKEVEKNLAGGDPYSCKKCKAFLNKFSKVLSFKQHSENPNKLVELKAHQSLWQCEFCSYPNIISIEKQEIPVKEDIFYMLESEHENIVTENDSTIVFCIDTSGSMNTTSEVQGKIDLKFGLSEEQINMLKQFMEPGDQAQFNFLPGAHNKNKTFISRKQCILSAIESHLLQLKKTDPFKRVGFVTFNNEITVIGDSKANTVNIVGDKLYKREELVTSLQNFKLTQPLAQCCNSLLDSLNKTEAKGQTALGPGLISALEVASKGGPGSTVTLCTDGLANIGLGSLDVIDEEKKKFYNQLGEFAKSRNIVVNILTIKGEGCKMQVIGKLAEMTNGNMKVVNPQKLSDDFANVMKDELVGLNVNAKIILHRAMSFRNEDLINLKDNNTILEKNYANATVNTKISFEYELRCEEDLKFLQIEIQKLKTVPFQAQITFTSPKGGKFLRVISSQSKTTTEAQLLKKQANLPVVHHRIGAITAQMYSQGDYKGSAHVNSGWANYLNKNFVQKEYEQEQLQFNSKNQRLNKAINHKYKKTKAKEEKVVKEQSGSDSDNSIKGKKRKLSLIDSDEDQMQLMDNVMEKGSYDLDKKERKRSQQKK